MGMQRKGVGKMKSNALVLKIIGIILCSSQVMASTVAYWRFEEGTPGNKVRHTLSNGMYEAAVPDSSGNGYELSAWSEEDGTGYLYSDQIFGMAIPQSGADNHVSIRNSGSWPALFTSTDDAIRTIKPSQFTIEAVFKLENGGHRTIVGRDSMGTVTSDSALAVLYFQAVPNNGLAIKYCDVSGYFHEAISGENIFQSFDNTANPTGQGVSWYGVAGICDGVTLSLYLADLDAGTGYKLIAQTDLTLSGSPDTAMSAGIGNGSDWTAGNWSVGRGIYGGGHTDRAYGFIDEVRISDSALEISYLLHSSRACAWNPTPSDGTDNYGFSPDGKTVSATLSWNAGVDLTTGQTNPKILVHSLYRSTNLNKTNDPNLIWVVDIPVSGSTGQAILTGLDYDGTYLWCVEEGVDDGAGSALPKGDPNNFVSPVWTFGSMKAVPVITSQPVSVHVCAGDSAVFTVHATSISPIQYQWFKASTSEQNPEIDLPVSADNTLAIDNAQLSDEGRYYCKVTNEGGTLYSSIATLAISRRMAYWPLNGSANEAVNPSLNGIITGSLNWVESPYGLAASFDSGDYITIPSDPNNKTLEIYDTLTVSCMVRNPGSTSWESFVSKSGENGTGWMLRQYSNTNTGLFTLRGTSGNDDPAGTYTINDGKWHHVVGVYDSYKGKRYLYVDGLLDNVINDTGSITPTSDPVMIGRTSADWANYFSGEMAHVEIYNYPLTDIDVASLYYSYAKQSFCKEKPAYDLTGDCQVNLDDFAVIASNWLTCGIYPDCY